MTEGSQESANDGKVRNFIITSTGMLSWVVGPTIDRKYKSRTSPRIAELVGKGKERESSSQP
jgi:hypothetical protein